MPRPPLYLNEVFDICSNSGIEKFNETPPTKKVNNGKIINKPIEI